MLEISNSWGLFLSKRLKSDIPKEGGTKDREFAAILTLKSCDILGFITHKKTQNFYPHNPPPPHLELGLRKLNGKQRYLIVSKADYLWLGIFYFRPSNTSLLRCISSISLFHSMKRCCEQSPANLPLGANPLEAGGICLLCCRDWSAVVQTRLCFQCEPPPDHYRRIHTVCTGVGGGD